MRRTPDEWNERTGLVPPAARTPGAKYPGPPEAVKKRAGFRSRYAESNKAIRSGYRLWAIGSAERYLPESVIASGGQEVFPPAAQASSQ